MKQFQAFARAISVSSLLVCAAAYGQSQPVVKTISLNDVWQNTSNSCTYHGSPTTIQFTDTAGSDWSTLEIRARMAYGHTNVDTPPTVTMWINNQMVGQPTTVFARAQVFCDGRTLYTFTAKKSEIPNYTAFGTNTFRMDSVGGYVGGDNPVELVFTTPAPTFAFTLGPNATAKMVTHNYNAQVPLPSGQLPTATNARPRYQLTGKVEVDGTGAARDIWFRVLDPKDSAPYGSPAANDNQDPAPRAFLVVPGCTTAACRVSGAAGLKMRSNSTGGVGVDLEGTDRYAGDNYQIEASFDANFTCATAGPTGNNICPKSGVITAWKRINVEMHKMFRRGAFLTRNIGAGDLIIPVTDVSVFPAPPFLVRLIHATDVDGGTPVDFYYEEVMVRHLEGRRVLNMSPAPGRLYLRHPSSPNVGDTIQGEYDQLENVLNRDRAYLADAVGIPSMRDDYMTVDTSLVDDLFNDAFVEFMWLPDEQGLSWDDPRYSRVIPYVEQLEHLDGQMSELLARKWMRHAQRIGVWRVAEPNHQMVFLSGNKWGQGSQRGDTRVGLGFNDLWLHTLETPNVDMRAEALTHELGHQWLVNQMYLNGQPTTMDAYPGGHCDLAFGAIQRMADPANATHYCEMTSGDAMWTGSEARDRRVGFHYTVHGNQQADSEYLHIRRRAEPVPQNDNPRNRSITQ